MKIKQLLPIALIAAMMTSAAFADEPPTPVSSQGTAAQPLQLKINDYINIWVKGGGNYLQTINITDAMYKEFSITTALDVDYGVITNKVGDVIYLQAKTGGGTQNALLAGADGNFRMAFAKNDTTPSDTAVAAVLNTATEDRTLHPNLIALNFTSDCTKDASLYPDIQTTTITPSAEGNSGNIIKYTIGAGQYDFHYTSATTDTLSLSPADEQGTYTTILTLSRSHT